MLFSGVSKRIRLAFLGGILLIVFGAWARQNLKKPHLPAFIADSISQIEIDARGDYYLTRGDGRLEKYDSADRLLWVAALPELSEPPAMHPYRFAVDPNGGVLAAGVTYEGRRTVIYRIGEDGPSAISLFGHYPGWTPVDIAFRPDGDLYFLAFDIDLFNQLLERPNAKEDPRCDFIHQLDDEGDVMRSFSELVYPKGEVKRLIEFADNVNRTRLIFSPSGRAFFAHQSKPLLHEIDLVNGRRLGSISLPFAGLAAGLIVEHVRFVDESEVAYLIARSDETRLVLDSQLWTLNLPSGSSTKIDQFDPRIDGIVMAQVDNTTGLVRVFASGRSPRTLRMVRLPSEEARHE